VEHGAADAGLMALMILALYDRLGVREAESFDHLHGLIEAAKRAIAVRDRCSPIRRGCRIRSTAIFTREFLDAEAAAIDRRKPAPWKAHEEVGDTIWNGRRDASGLVVSYISSLYWEFGSGVVAAADRHRDAEPRL